MYMEGKKPNLSPEQAALKLLGLKWERQPEPCHDHLLFLTRSPDSLRFATASSEFYSDHVTEVWSLPERKLLYRLPTPNAETMSLDWLQGDGFVTAGHDCVVSVWQGNRKVLG